jgi:hypothetical protein
MDLSGRGIGLVERIPGLVRVQVVDQREDAFRWSVDGDAALQTECIGFRRRDDQ